MDRLVILIELMAVRGLKSVQNGHSLLPLVLRNSFILFPATCLFQILKGEFDIQSKLCGKVLIF